MDSVLERDFERGSDAIRELVKYVRKCLLIGGLPMIRTKYIAPFERPDKRGVMVLCYGRADVMHREWIWAPKADKEWSDLVDRLERTVGDYRVVLEKYGHLVSEKEALEELKKEMPEPVIEALRARPLIGWK